MINNIENNNNKDEVNTEKKEIKDLYQKNVLKESNMYKQTSPINIINCIITIFFFIIFIN